MRIDPNQIDKFGSVFGARGYRPKKPAPPSRVTKPKAPAPVEPPEQYDDEGIAPGTRLYKTQRERQIEAIEREKRLFAKAQAARQCRLDRVAQEVPGVARFLKSLKRIEPDAEPTAYRDIDVDLADLARRCGVSKVARDYDRFTVYEEAVLLVARVAKRAKRYTAPDAADFFTQSSMTTLDELKEELRLR